MSSSVLVTTSGTDVFMSFSATNTVINRYLKLNIKIRLAQMVSVVEWGCYRIVDYCPVLNTLQQLVIL